MGVAEKPVYVYDLNSSYSAGWLEGPMPAGPWKATRKEVPNRIGVYWCPKICQDRKSLPVVATDDRWAHDGGGWVTSEELTALREAGGDAKVERGWYSETTLPLCQELVRMLYPLKQAKRPGMKEALNAIHGKTVQGLVGSTYVHTSRGYVVDEDLHLPAWYQRPLLGMVLYGRARLREGRIGQKLIDAGHELYAMRADSVHTSCPPRDFPGALGSACGEWRCEYERAEGVYAGVGLYALRDRDGFTLKVASTGISAGAVTFDMVERVAEGQEVTASHRGGLVGFRAQSTAWERKVAEQSITLRVHTAGKLGKQGWLRYPEATETSTGKAVH